MPSKSKSQQRLMGVAYAVKSGDMQLSDVDSNYRDKVKDLVDGMTLKQLKDFAETKHDKLPEVVQEGIVKIDLDRTLVKIMSALGFKQNPNMRQELLAAFRKDLQEIMTKYDYIVEGDSEFFKGGVANGMSEEELAKHHDIPLTDIKRALAKGQSVEMEHTNDKEKAYEIAKDHVYEDPEYYDKLAKVEEADFYNITPNNIGGMGPISLPGVDSLGSGDVPVGQAEDDEDDEENGNVLSFEAYLNEFHQIKAFEPEVPKGEKLGEDDYEPGPANDPDAEMRERMKTLKKARGVISFKDFNAI